MNEEQQQPKLILSRRDILIRGVISFIISGIISLIVLATTYNFDWAVDNVSNSIFVVNIPIFLIGVILQTGATRATLGTTYTTRMLFSYRKMKDEYETFGDYYDEKSSKHSKNVVYVLAASAIWIAVAVVLSIIYLEYVPNM